MGVCACGATDDDDHAPSCASFLLVGCWCCKAPLISKRALEALESHRNVKVNPQPLQHGARDVKRAALLRNLEDRGPLAHVCDSLCEFHRGAVIGMLVVFVTNLEDL